MTQYIDPARVTPTGPHNVTGVQPEARRATKYVYTYQIWGRSAHGKECIDTADTRKEALILAREYRLAFGSGWRIWVRTVRAP